MSVTNETDESILAAVQRWHIFNRDPSDQHWQNIDTLLHKIENTPAEIDEAVTSEKSYWQDEMAKLESQLDDLAAERDASDDARRRLEIELDEAHGDRRKLEIAADELDNARVEHALKIEAENTRLQRKCRALQLFAETCARERDGEAGVVKIRKVLDRIDAGVFIPGQ